MSTSALTVHDVVPQFVVGDASVALQSIIILGCHELLLSTSYLV